MITNKSLLSELGVLDVEKLLNHSNTKTYPANTIIINEGDESNSFYIIKEGKVKVFVSDEDGKEVILNILEKDQYFGELALLDDQPRSASVITARKSILYVISKSDFIGFVKSEPVIAFNLIRSLTRQIRSLTLNVKSLALMDVYGRVAHTLLDLSKEVDGRLVIEQKLTQQEIANMVGSSREMVSRILTDLTRGGYISVEKKLFTINEKLPARW